MNNEQSFEVFMLIKQMLHSDSRLICFYKNYRIIRLIVEAGSSSCKTHFKAVHTVYITY